MLAIALVGVLLFQDPAPSGGTPPKVDAGKSSDSSQSSSSKKLETWPDKDARAKVKAFEKALKPKKVSMPERKEALEQLASSGLSTNTREVVDQCLASPATA